MKLDVAGAPVYAYSGGKAFDAALPAVVLLHGALHDHSVWTLGARWLANHGRAVLAIDLPGHGRSGGAAHASVETLADWLLSVLDAAGVARAALVGHSMGSLVALEAAGRAPDRATHLVMVGTAYPMKVSQALLDQAANDPAGAIAAVNGFSHSGLAAKPSYPGPGSWLHGANSALMHRMQGAHGDGNLFLKDFRVCDNYRAGFDAARLVTCPTTFILGAGDQMTSPRGAGELATALRATIVELPAGHALMSEAPDAVIAAVAKAVG